MRVTRTRIAPGNVGLAAAVALAGCAPEGGRTPTAYVELLGSDTMAVEIVNRGDARIDGEIVRRSPVTRRTTYSVELDESGTPVRFETEHTTPPENPDGPGRWHAEVAFDGASATVTRTLEQTTETVTVDLDGDGPVIPTTGTIPLATGLLELAIQQARNAGATEAFPIRVFTPWGATPRATPNAIVPRGAGEFAIDFFGRPMVASVNAEGHVVGVSGAETTMQVEVEPAAGVDLDALAASFASRDARGEGVGQPSPPATVVQAGGGAHFQISYSRPAMRGRSIWGGLVAYDTVWRTGANAATQFETDRDVRVGDLDVPAGRYTLWTTFTRQTATLIVNRQTDIWGTAYNAETDLGRTALERETLDEPVERFTIDIEPTDTGGILHLSWDRTRFSVPIVVR